MRPVFLLAAVLAAACASRPDARPRTVVPGDSVRLHVTDSFRIEGSEVLVEFASVIADSRCPRDVTCVWQGDAEVSLRAVAGASDSADLRLHTGLEPRSASFAGYRFTLLDLEPVPASGLEPRQSEYVATIGVERPT